VDGARVEGQGDIVEGDEGAEAFTDVEALDFGGEMAFGHGISFNTKKEGSPQRGRDRGEFKMLFS
jgi:hypothetical protein